MPAGSRGCSSIVREPRPGQGRGAAGYCHTALPGSRGFCTKHPGGCRGCTFLPDVFAPAHRPHRTDHTCIWGSASGLPLPGHWAAVVAYVLLIFGSSETPVGRTPPYVPRVSACSRKYRLQIVFSLNVYMSNQISSCTALFGSKYRGAAWKIAIHPGVYQR